ncbi:MAG TPA: methyltransferase domain-containing protein [Caulobacteraceae bacterium]|nr:methyltransferase domain-containing protein [Caulobacteraceae bacterium]
MSLPDDDGPNAAQIAYWNVNGANWVALQDVLDTQLQDLGLAAMAALGVGEGERVIDIGCGCGATTMELARRVGAGGKVLGADISAPMLEVARRRAGELGLGHVGFVEADAQIHAFEPADAAFSRFGVMFFADPSAAFANIRKALAPAGRLAFVCWRVLAENPWMTIPMAAVAPLVPSTPPPPPNAPGPFAFADRDRVHGILTAAGFTQIAIDPHNQAIGQGDLETTVRTSLNVGPVGAALRENPQLRGPITEAVRAALAPHAGADGVKLPSATWIVTAR